MGARLSKPWLEVKANNLFKYAWYAASFEYGAVEDAGGACKFAKVPNLNPYAADVVAPEAPWKFVYPLRIQRFFHGQGWAGWEYEVQPWEARLYLLALRKEIEAHKQDWHLILLKN